MNAWTVDLTLWQFPASLILGAAFLLGVWVLGSYYRTSRLCRVLGGGATAVVLLSVAAIVLAVEGIWALGLYRTWPFILLVLLIMANLGLVILRRLSQRDAGFLLNHAGLLLILWGAAFGAPDTVEARMRVGYNSPVRLAHTPSGEVVPLPFEVQLQRFSIDYYDDGRTPRQFRAELLCDGELLAAEVNAPAHYGGYTIYQEGYDTVHGAYTVLLLVRDPWLWVVWLGVAMLAAGSITLLFRKR